MRTPNMALLAALSLGSACSSSGGQPVPFNVAASVVIGQSDFVSSGANAGSAAPSGRGFDRPVGSASFAAGRLLLPDTGNHRVLEFAGLPTANGASAAGVHGQPDLVSGTPSLTPARLYRPQSVWADGSRVVIADTGASRVQLGPGATPVLVGWGVDGAYRTGCAADMLSDPWRAIIVGTRLIVADRSNHRVLVWNRAPTVPGPADLVLGQQDLEHCAPNDSLGSGVPGGRSERTLRFPTDVWSDGERLLVVDQGNNRVLLWNRFPSANGAPADVVLGQVDVHAGAGKATQSGMSGPGFVASDGNRIYVADVRNNRVLGWRSFPTTSGAPADVVLGQEDFVHTGQNGHAAAVGARTLDRPMGVALVGSSLIVTDTYNNRYLVFSSP
jgi:hypothetical protein